MLEKVRESQCIITKTVFLSYFKGLPHVPSNLKLDTAKKASTVKEILLTEYINNELFAEEVAFTDKRHLNRVLNHPITWAECTEFKKKLFCRMHLWSQSADEIRSLKKINDASHTSKKVKKEISYYRSLPEVPANLQLDTAIIGRKVKEILQRESIPHDIFAQVAHLYKSEVCTHLNHPKPWVKCTE